MIRSMARRKGMMSALAILLCAGAAWAAGGEVMPRSWLSGVTARTGMVLQTLEITGLDRTSRRSVLARLHVDRGMPLGGIDLQAMKQRLEGLPWVARARVTRSLPGRLIVAITEREPRALWQRDGTLHVVDRDGTPITDRGISRFAHLRLVVGPGANRALDQLDRMLAHMPELAPRVARAVRVGDRRWDLLFDNGIRLRLPADDAPAYDAARALARFRDLEAQYRLLSREVQVIDLRLPDRLVMRVTEAGQRMMAGEEKAM
ncbi:cell division protein FtsQ/DivIB [Yunchengibacter salinarum]|uniref:cell division protein FtsQ/DivIB n=1 Tax=Yunchengibacter salinarum TaxID=3133399 RepID=UPI0035B63180